jgi:hypothetical protein
MLVEITWEWACEWAKTRLRTAAERAKTSLQGEAQAWKTALPKGWKEVGQMGIILILGLVFVWVLVNKLAA